MEAVLLLTNMYKKRIDNKTVLVYADNGDTAVLHEEEENLCTRGYCTCFWDKILNYVLIPCCKLHDFNYGKQHISRAEADKRLFNCLKKHSFFLLAGFMWLGVRTFGWYFWRKARKEKMKNVSNAIMMEDELLAHFGEQTEDGEYVNHYLYQKRDDNTLTAWMCCDFEVVGKGGDILFKGGCGDGICYDLEKYNVTLEKRK